MSAEDQSEEQQQHLHNGKAQEDNCREWSRRRDGQATFKKQNVIIWVRDPCVCFGERETTNVIGCYRRRVRGEEEEGNHEMIDNSNIVL